MECGGKRWSDPIPTFGVRSRFCGAARHFGLSPQVEIVTWVAVLYLHEGQLSIEDEIRQYGGLRL